MSTVKNTNKQSKTAVKAAPAKGGKASKRVAEPVQSQTYTDDIRWRIILGLVALLFAVIICVSYFASEGAFLRFFVNFLNKGLGIGYYAVGPMLLLISWVLLLAPEKSRTVRAILAFLVPFLFSSIVSVFGGKGGSIGELFAGFGVRYIGSVPTGIIIGVSLVVSVFIALGATTETIARIGSAGEEKYVKGLAPAAEPAPSYVPAKSPKKIMNPVQPVVNTHASGRSYDIPLGVDSAAVSQNKTSGTSAGTARKARNETPIVTEIDNRPVKPVEPLQTVKPVQTPKPVVKRPVEPVEDLPPLEDESKKLKKADIEIEKQKIEKEIDTQKESGEYVYPPTELLNYAKGKGSDSDGAVQDTRERLESTLHSFGINSYVTSITQGPTVTRYDIELEQGVKLAKVTNLAGDIALALGVLNVRIAPIPDEISTVGIEVPNKIVNTVSLREIVESSRFISAGSKLSFAIGKDIGGHAITGDISKLPHMLIAGTTGSGKSVCMNSLIISLLYKARPDEVKFIMIDPKMVELGVYNSIPHLYVPVVTEPKKAAGALQWAVVEMLKRYRLFSEAGVRDLATYNATCEHDGEDKLPSVVIVIDELADLMMAASKEVEESICRVAQMGRAAGMHLIIATQRPSADVITGLMKANIPSRIAFAVSSAMESRIIMDQSGAEKLVGHGDMLYSPIGCGKPLRVQGAFVSDQEREKVIKFITSNCSIDKEVNKELQDAMNSADSQSSDSSKGSGKDSSQAENSLASEYDAMLPQAAEVVLEMGSCSVSMLQRRLKLGYSRAARVVDQLEELGIVGEYQGAKPRDVITDRQGWNEIQIRLGLAVEDDFAMAAEMSEQAETEKYNEL